MALSFVAATLVSTSAMLATGDAASADLPTCALSSLPDEATDTANLIKADGPFPYDQDGTVFQNREGILPSQDSGYYHEYTVKTPGQSTRGARRIVTGGTPLTSPPGWFYTGDHYESFCKITGV